MVWLLPTGNALLATLLDLMHGSQKVQIISTAWLAFVRCMYCVNEGAPNDRMLTKAMQQLEAQCVFQAGIVISPLAMAGSLPCTYAYEQFSRRRPQVGSQGMPQPCLEPGLDACCIHSNS
jgi:hypothetical protein